MHIFDGSSFSLVSAKDPHPRPQAVERSSRPPERGHEARGANGVYRLLSDTSRTGSWLGKPGRTILTTRVRADATEPIRCASSTCPQPLGTPYSHLARRVCPTLARPHARLVRFGHGQLAGCWRPAPRVPARCRRPRFAERVRRRCTFGGRSLPCWFMVSYCRFRPSPHVYALPGAGVRWWLICSIEWYVRAARTPCLRRLSCRSVRSNPTTVVGPRPTVSGCGCAPAPAARSSPRGAARAAPSSLPECCVLPAAHRMRRSGDFATAIRTGRRAGSRRLVVHVATTDEHRADAYRIGGEQAGGQLRGTPSGGSPAASHGS